MLFFKLLTFQVKGWVEDLTKNEALQQFQPKAGALEPWEILSFFWLKPDPYGSWLTKEINSKR